MSEKLIAQLEKYLDTTHRTVPRMAWAIVQEDKVSELYTLLLMLGAFPPAPLKNRLPPNPYTVRFNMGSLWMKDTTGQFRTVFLPAQDNRKATMYLTAIRRCLE